MPQIVIKGVSGRIEARYKPAQEKGAPIALILHSNPEKGGSMNDKVTYTLYRSFTEMGFATLRFNFRGVGRSEGEYSGGEGELQDASSCLNWLCSQNPEPKTCFVAGFSFGAYIGMQLLMRRPEVKRFISVAPPVNLYDFSFLAPCPAPGFVVQGTDDVVVPREVVNRFVNRLNSQPNMNVIMRVVRQAQHDFKGYLVDIFDAVQDYVQKQFQDPTALRVRRKRLSSGDGSDNLTV